MEDIKKINKKLDKMTKNGEIQQAIEYCKNLLVDENADTNLHIRLGDLYLDRHLDIYQAKQYIDEAITEYQKAAEVLIDNGKVYYKIGLAFFHKGELERAINYFNIASDKGYNKAQSHYMIAKAFQRKDRIQDALFHVNVALKNCFFSSSRIHYLKFRLLNSLYFSNEGQKLHSIKELLLSYLTLPFDREALKILKDKLKWFKILFIVLRAHYFLLRGEIEQAYKVYYDALNKMQGCAALYVALGDAYRKTGRLEDSISEYKMALWIESDNHAAFAGIVQAYEELGDYDNAINYYDKYIKIHPNSSVLHNNIANLYATRGDTELALSHYQTAIMLSPNAFSKSATAQTLGLAQQIFSKNPEAAISSFLTANVLTPDQIDVYLFLGSAFYDNQDFSNALIVYRRALELAPNNSKIHCNLGYLHWGLGDLDEAIKEYKLSIKFDPSYDIAHNNLGVIYLDDLVQLQNAIDCFNKALIANPNYALAYYNLGRCYALKGENVEAAKYFQTALDVNNVTNEIDPVEIQDRLNSLFD
ncbi:tetratricopeptide repeat protein [bacterium]|nr:tetratricopeptide repeat protein [bacterium]